MQFAEEPPEALSDCETVRAVEVLVHSCTRQFPIAHGPGGIASRKLGPRDGDGELVREPCQQRHLSCEVLLDVRAPREADDPFARDNEHEIVQARLGECELAISEIGEAVRECSSWFHSY